MTAAFRRYLHSLLSTLGLARSPKRQPLRKETLRRRTRLGMEFLEDRLAPAIFNVATFGNDLTGDGSAANPFRTMQRAINQAAAFADGNDTINLAGGTYNQAGVDLNSTVPNSPNITNLSILGGWNNTFTVRDPLVTPTTWAPQTPALATVDLLIQDANVTVDGFQFQFAAAGLRVQNANNVRIQNNSFLRVGPANAGGNSLLSALANASNVADFVALNNTLDAGLGIAASSGIDLLGTGGFQITNAVITNTSVTNASGSGLRITNATTPTITGGSFSGNFIGVVLLDAANAFLTSTAINNNSSDGLLVSNILAVDLNLSNLTLTGNGSGATLTNVNGLNYVSSLGTVNDVLAVTPSQIILNRAGSLQQAINLVTLNFVKLDLGDGNDEAIFDTAVYPFAILEVNAQGGTDTLTYNATAGNDTIIINNTTFTINGNTPPIQGPLVILQGFEEYSVNGLGGDDNFFVRATNAPVTLRGGLDNDTFFLGNAGTLDNLLVNLTLDGGAGSNGVELDDSAEATGNSYTATTGSVIRNGGFTVSYANLATVAITGGSAPDTFNVTPDAVVTYTIVGNNPTLPTLPGDVLNLNLAGITNPTNFITGPGDGIFNFGNANPVGYQNIETVNTAGTPFDLVFNLNFSIFGNDGVADILRASLSASGTNFILERLGDPPFYTGQLYNGDVTLIRSFSVIGSFDDDTLIVQETAGGLLGQTGGFFGNAVGSHLNAPMQFFLNQLGQPTNVGLHFDGGLGGTNRLQYELLTQRDAQYFADAVAAARSGNVNIGATGGASASQLRSSFANLAPIGFLGAGGTLTVDNTGISGVGDVLTVEDDAVAGDGISQVTSSNPLFETTFFEGFNDLQVFGGSGGQTLIMNGLDSAATEVLVLLNGDDTFGSDVGDDQFFIRQSAAAVLTQAVGGGGNDTFNVGNAAGVVDNILGDVELYGDGGTQDVVLYNDAGTAVGQTYTIESTRINRSGGVGEVRYSSMEQLNVFTSSDSDVINIRSTLATTPLFVQAGAGNDFINLSSDAPLNSGNLDGIAGTVNLDAGSGANTLSVSDLTGTTANSNAFIGFNQILGFAGPTDATVINYTATGGSFSAINIEGSVNVGDTFTVNNPNGPLNLNTYGGADTVNVQAINFVANIDTGADSDTINVSSDAPANLGNLDAINATLNLEAGTGANVLNVSDFNSATANANAIITVNQIIGLAGPTDNQTINYLATGGSFSQIRVDGSNTSSDIFTVNNPNGPLTLNTHGGADDVFLQANIFAVNVNGGADDDEFILGQGNVLDNLLGLITLDGGTGFNTAVALDAAQVVGRTYGLVAGLFTRDGGIQVNFANLAEYQIYAGTGSDIFNVGTSTETIFILNGNLPAFPTLPGDTLNLDLTGATNPQLNLGNPGTGQFTFGNRQTIFYTSIETLNPTNGQIDLVVDLNQIPAWGNNGIADIIEIRLDAAGTNLLLDRLGALPDFVGIFFNATVAAIRSVAIIGSNDNDTLRVREVNGRLPGETGGLNGNAVGSHLNAPMNFFLTQAGQPTNLGLNFNGGGGSNRLQFVFTTSRNSRFFADTMAAARSGNINVSGTGGTPVSAVRVSFESLAPIDFFGAGGTLTVDNTGISGLFDQLTVQDNAIAGDGISQVVSTNAAFETTNFTGFDAVAVLAGTGDQTLIMNGLDSAATETSVLLDGDDTFGTDFGSDTFFVYQSAAAVTTTLLGGAGNDIFSIGNPAQVVDNILGNVLVDGETGANDILFYRDNGNAVGYTYTVRFDRINRSGGVGEVVYLNQDIVELHTSQAADQIDILSTNATTATRVFAGAGSDVINVSSDAPANLGNLDGIAGELSIDGQGDANVLNISDFGGTTPNANVVIGFSTITGFAGPTDNTLINYTANGGTFSAINIEGSNTVGDTFTVQNPNGPLNLNTNGGADTVNVQAISFVANINTGAGDDQINVSSNAPAVTGTLDAINATLNLEAGSGANILTVHDYGSTTANTNVIITATQFLNFAGPTDNQTINYLATGGTFSAINVNGSNFVGDVFTVQSPNGPLFLFGNGGDDTFNIQSLTNIAQVEGQVGNDLYNVSSDAPTNLGNLDGLLANLFIIENSGLFNRIRISDFSTTTLNSNVVIGFDRISGLAGPADATDIFYTTALDGQFSELRIDGSNDPLTAEDYRVQSPNAPLFLNLHAGNDSARVQSIFQAAQINGGDEDDLFIVSSTGNTFNGHLNDINAPLALNGDGGQNEMHIVDFDGGTNPNIGFTNSLIGGIAGATNNQTISYSNGAGLGDTLLLILQGSNTAIDNLNIFSTLANSTNNFFLNGGDDGFVVLSSAANSPGIANLFGGAGNDEFAFADGAALNTGFIDGGTGVNLLNYVTWTTAVSVNLGTGLATGLLNNGVFEGNRIAPLTIQNIVGGSAGDLLLGDSQANRIEGRGGNNQIAGQGGDDILLGGTGNDVIMGGPGNDMLYGGGGRDAYFGDYVRPGSPVPPIPGAINNGPPGYNVIVLTNCNELRQGRRGAIVIDPGGGPGVRGRIVVARFRNGQLVGPVFVRVGPVTLGPLVPMIQPRYTGQIILPPVLIP